MGGGKHHSPDAATTAPTSPINLASLDSPASGETAASTKPALQSLCGERCDGFAAWDNVLDNACTRQYSLTSLDSDASLDEAGQACSVSCDSDPFLGWLSSRSDTGHSSWADFEGAAEDGESQATAVSEQAAQPHGWDGGLRKEIARLVAGHHQALDGGAMLWDALLRLEKQELTAVSMEHCARESPRPAESAPGNPEGLGRRASDQIAATQDERGKRGMCEGQASRAVALQGELDLRPEKPGVKDLQEKAAAEMARLAAVQAGYRQRIQERATRREQLALELQGAWERLDRRLCGERGCFSGARQPRPDLEVGLAL